MSEVDVWCSMWKAECTRANEWMQRAHAAELKFIKAHSQRQSLKFHVELAAGCLKASSPGVSDRLIEVIKELDKDYETFLAKPASDSAHSAPSGPANQAGSSAVSETAAQLEGTQALPVSDRSSFLPPAVRYEGNWDDCALTKHQAD